MPYCCKDECSKKEFKEQYKVKRALGGTGQGFKKVDYQHNKNKYTLGYKRCKTCSVFLKTEQLYCNCCGVMLRNVRERTTPYIKPLEYQPISKLTGVSYSIKSDILINRDKWNTLLKNV